MHSRKMERWQEDQRCIFEIMTDARKIKISLRWVYFWEEVASERRGELLKAAAIMSARGKRWTLLSYLFSFPIPLSTFCSSREYGHPGEENSSYLARKIVLFYPPSWQTREFRVYGPSEKAAQCTLCIVNVSKICTVVSYIKTDVSLPRDRRGLTSLNVTKRPLMTACQLNTRPFPLFPTIECKSYSS